MFHAACLRNTWWSTTKTVLSHQSALIVLQPARLLTASNTSSVSIHSRQNSRLPQHRILHRDPILEFKKKKPENCWPTRKPWPQNCTKQTTRPITICYLTTGISSETSRWKAIQQRHCPPRRQGPNIHHVYSSIRDRRKRAKGPILLVYNPAILYLKNCSRKIETSNHTRHWTPTRKTVSRPLPFSRLFDLSRVELPRFRVWFVFRWVQWWGIIGNARMAFRVLRCYVRSCGKTIAELREYVSHVTP